MPGTKKVEWHQTHENHVLDLSDTIPPIPLQPLTQADPLQLICHQPPMVSVSTRVRAGKYILMSNHMCADWKLWLTRV